MGHFVDLTGEWVAALGAMKFEQLKWLVGRGIGVKALNAAGWFGGGTILPAVSTYLPGDVGCGTEIGALILGVWNRLWLGELEPWAVREFGPPELIDLVAIDVRNPQRWWLRLGGDVNGPLWLGQGPGFADPDEEGVIDLHATPFDWLKAGCRGKVLLDAAGYSALEIFSDCKYIRTGGTGSAKTIYDDLRAGTRPKFPSVLVRDLGFEFRTEAAA